MMAWTADRTTRRAYRKGEKVRDIHTDKVYVVKRSYWQEYAGGDTADYTVELEQEDPDQPTPWNKSRNLEPWTMEQSIERLKKWHKQRNSESDPH